MKLYDFQQQYLQGLPAKYIFSCDTGTGKEFMSIAHYDKHAYLTPLLVLAPASKIREGSWQRSIAAWFEGRLMPEVQYFSYEKFSRSPTVKKYRETGEIEIWRQYLKDNPNFAVIADECHKAANPQSGIGKVVYEMSQRTSFFIGLSATPHKNGWIDVCNYFKMFGFTKNKTEFKKRYVDEVNFGGFPQIRGYHREDELKRLWNRIAKPLDKSMALDLPPIVTVPIALTVGAEYHRIQAERLFGAKFLDNPSALLHALRQSTSTGKLPWLNEYLEGNSGHTIIFYNYKSELKEIKAMLKKSHKARVVFEQNGDKHEIPNKTQWDNLPERTITLAQYQSGSTGIEMSYADTIVYFSPTYSYVDFEQSIGRIYRNGQKNKCTLYLLCCPSTVERDIWAAVKDKGTFNTQSWYDRITNA